MKLHRYIEYKSEGIWHLLKLEACGKDVSDIFTNVLGDTYRFGAYIHIAETFDSYQKFPDDLSSELKSILNGNIEGSKEIDELKQVYLEYAEKIKRERGHYPIFHEERLRDNFKKKIKFAQYGYFDMGQLHIASDLTSPMKDVGSKKYEENTIVISQFLDPFLYMIRRIHPNIDFSDIRVIFFTEDNY